MTVAATKERAPSPEARAVSPAEWQTRVDLAACYRLVAHHGWTHLLSNHLSARVPGEPDHFLINPFGLLFDEINASNLVKMTLDGTVVSDTPHGVNRFGYLIHSTVLAARPDVNCVIHTHTAAGMALSALECGLLPLTASSMRFYQKIGYQDFGGPDETSDDARRKLGSALDGNNIAVILRNHGLLAFGGTVADAFENMYSLEKACVVQLMAQNSGANLVIPSDELCTKTGNYRLTPDTRTSKDGKPIYHSPREGNWSAWLRLADRLDPSYRD